MMDRQCSSCGGFCKKSGCERENVPEKPKRQWVGLTDEVDDAITSLRKAIQEEALRNVQRIGQEIEQEPVAWGVHDQIALNKTLETHPQPKREWVGLTDEEIEMVIDKVSREVGYYPSAWDMVSPRTLIAAVIEAAHGLKEKNT